MPISSGANNWPNQYVRRPESPPKKNVSIKWWNYKTEPSPTPTPTPRAHVEKLPQKPPPYIIYDDHEPKYDPYPRAPISETQPSYRNYKKQRKPKKSKGCCKYRDGSFTNGMYAANTGCCQGGIFGNLVSTFQPK